MVEASMIEEDVERELKIIVVGNGGVGKTSMINLFAKGQYAPERRRTIGVDFLEKRKYVEALACEVRMQLWDTAGQEAFDTLTKQYFRGAGAAIVAFSTTDRESFEAAEGWCTKVRSECPDAAMALVQTKVDQLDDAVMSSAEAEALARKLGLKIFRTCVSENLNVQAVFSSLAEAHFRGQASKGIQGAHPVSEGVRSASISATTHSHSAARDAATTGASAPKTVVLRPSKQRTAGVKESRACRTG